MALIEIIALITISSILLGFGLNHFLRKRVDYVISLFQSYLAGLTIIYLLVLTGLPLGILIQGLLYFSLAAVAFIIYSVFRLRTPIFNSGGKINYLDPLFLFAFLAYAFFLSQNILEGIIYEPITAWDARSIFYLKAKQLFFADGLNPDAGINSFNAVNYSHPEYPLLIPALGALLAKHIGFWNEYFPKSNLVFLWIGVVLALFSLKHMHLIAKVVIFFSLMIVSPVFLKIGYLDVWLGIYVSLSILFLIEYIRHLKPDYLVSFLVCTIFCNYVKQDASILTVSIICSFLFWMVLTFNKRLIRYTFFRTIRLIPVLLILLVPFVLWAIYKSKWDLSSTDFDFGKITRFADYGTTFSASKFDQIYKSLIIPVGFVKIVWVLSAFAIGSFLYARFTKVSKPVLKNGILQIAFPILASIFFATGMIVLYCLSARDLEWHLTNSANRLSVHMVFMAVPALYGAAGLLFYDPYKKKVKKLVKKKKKKSSTIKKKKKYP